MVCKMKAAKKGIAWGRLKNRASTKNTRYTKEKTEIASANLATFPGPKTAGAPLFPAAAQ